MVKLKIWVLQSMYVLIDKTVKWSRYEDSGGLYVIILWIIENNNSDLSVHIWNVMGIKIYS